jgi:DUF1365 family protein
VTASALYTGTVRHERLADHPGAFVHPVAFAYLDLDELPGLLGGRLVRRRPGVHRVRDRDLLGGATEPASAAVRALVEERTGRPAAAGPIRVLTTPRTWGVNFNPVSFYFCFDAAERLDAVVAEVTNTPWGRRHAYVLRPDRPGRVLRGAHAKVLPVSPFQHMDHRHEWAASVPGETLGVHIVNRTGDGTADFAATLKLRRRPLTTAGLRRDGALRTLALIYGHALMLRLRGASTA